MKSYPCTQKGLQSIDTDFETASASNLELIEKREALQNDVKGIEHEIRQKKALNALIKEKIGLLERQGDLRVECEKNHPSLLGAIESAKHERNQVMPNAEREMNSILMKNFPSMAAWEHPIWQRWVPDLAHIKLPEFLRVGEGANGVPVGVSFMGQNDPGGAVLILASEEKTDLAKEVLACLLLRVALSLPKVSRFCLVDPEHHGRSFRMQKDLTDVRKVDSSLEQDLQAISSDIRRISTDVLGYEDSFEHLSPDVWASERFESVFVADFGVNKVTNSRVFEVLLDIANGGRAAGRYLFMHVNTDSEFDRGIDLSKFKNAEIIDLNQDINIKFDTLPHGSEQSRLLNIVRNQQVPKKEISFESLVGVDASSGWTASSNDYIETPVGDNLSVWFGEKDGRSCTHAALAGSTGSGKSNFLHVLITGLALRYSPKELKLYLVDGKSGVGFKRYERLPHADVVSLQTSPLLALSVIRDISSEMEARYHLFSESGVKDIAVFRAKFPDQPMPRILLVADEYQNLFESNAEEATSIVSKLAEKGRAAGIHLLLSSQRFVAQGMSKSEYIFNNIAMRIALQLSDTGSIVEFFGQKGRKMIKELDRPGMVVINDNLGEDSASKRGMTAMLSDDESEKINSELLDRAKSDLTGCSAPVVFHGNERPEFMDSKTIQLLLSNMDWQASDKLELLAKRTARDGGFGFSKWHASQKPLALMAGRLFEVYGDFLFSLHRSGNEHALVISDNDLQTIGLLSSSLASIAATHAPAHVEFRILDLIHADMPGGGGLARLNDELLTPLAYSVTIERSSNCGARMLRSLAELVDERKTQSNQLDQSSIITVVSGLDDVDMLVTSETGHSAQQIKSDIQKVLRYGSQVGIHLMLQISSIQQFSSLLDEHKDLKRFNHRISWQISEEDSRKLMGTNEASRLAELADGEIAMYKNTLQGRSGVRYFRPYSVGHDELRSVYTKLSGRVK